MIVDYDGRVVVQATPGDGEKITVGPIDVEMLREERRVRLAHQMPEHLRTEAHPGYSRPVFPGGRFKGQKDITYEDNAARIGEVKRRQSAPERG